MRNRLDAVKVRNRVNVNGVESYQFVSDTQYIFSGVYAFPDQKFYLRNAGRWGTAASVLILSGGIMGLAGSLTNMNSRYGRTDSGGNVLVVVGAVFSLGGTLLLIPTFVQLIRAGKVKSYQTL